MKPINWRTKDGRQLFIHNMHHHHFNSTLFLLRNNKSFRPSMLEPFEREAAIRRIVGPPHGVDRNP